MPNKLIRVLLIEDNPIEAKLRCQMLHGVANFSCECAASLAAGLDRLARGGIDAVVLDLSLPDSSGLETVHAVHEASADVPVVVLTASDDADLAGDVVQAGAQDCLYKPQVDSHGFMRAIRYAVRRHALEEQLRQSQKIQAIGQLAGGVAHDFNNLLTIINGRAQMALAKMKPGEPFQKEMQVIYDAGQRAAVLTRQLLAFSRRQNLRLEILELNAVISDVEKMLRRIVPENIAMNFVLAPKLNSVKADRGQLEQVLINLVANARDAMPTGGSMTIQTENVNQDPPTSSMEQQILLSVTDSGTGMSPATIARVFEPFFTTKPQGEGSGLGMAIVHGVVAQLGGHIEIFSDPGKGVSVKIYLPALDTPAKARSSQMLQAVDVHNETVLLVEDDAGVRDLTRDVIRMSGYAVLSCADAQEALRVSGDHKEPIHLLIADIVMPGMSGAELAVAMKPQRPDMRVLFMSGYSGRIVGEQHLIPPNAHFIHKPFTPADLARKVREILAAPNVS